MHTIIRLSILLLLLALNAFSQNDLSVELNALVERLESSASISADPSLQKCAEIIMNSRNAPYALLHEHTGLFEWQLLPNCYYDWEIDTTTVVNVDVDYKPSDDYFSTIPAHFYFDSKRPYASLDDYKTLMISVFKSLGTNITVIFDEPNTKYGHIGHHYCQSFYYGSTKMLIDCYFVYVDDVACAVYYMTGYSFYHHFLYQIFFDTVMNNLQFKSTTNTSHHQTEMPAVFELSQNYPNPYNAETTIKYTVSSPGNVNLTIFNLQGKAVATIVDAYHVPGAYSVKYRATDLASGAYIYQISDASSRKSHLMLLVK